MSNLLGKLVNNALGRYTVDLAEGVSATISRDGSVKIMSQNAQNSLMDHSEIKDLRDLSKRAARLNRMEARINEKKEAQISKNEVAAGAA